MKGTVRTKDERTKAIIIKRMGEICTGIATATGATIDFNYRHGYPATKSTVRVLFLFEELPRKFFQAETFVYLTNHLREKTCRIISTRNPGPFSL